MGQAQLTRDPALPGVRRQPPARARGVRCKGARQAPALQAEGPLAPHSEGPDPSPRALPLLHNGSEAAGGCSGTLGCSLCPRRAAVGGDLPGPSQQVVLLEKGLRGRGQRRQVRSGGAAGRASAAGPALPCLLLPLAAPSSTSKGTHERGFPGRRAAQWRLCGAAAFIAVRQTGRNSHFPPGWSPARRRPAWRTL